MTQEKAKIIEKVQKLHAKAQNAEEIGSKAEAEIFARKVKAMMDKHKLSMTDIAYKEYDESDIKNFIVRWSEFGHKSTKKRCQWTSNLCNQIAKYNSCRMFVFKGSNSVSLYGREEDIEAVKCLLSVLVPVCIKLDERAYHEIYWEVRPLPEYERKKALKGFRLSWKLGFVDGVFLALKEQQEASIKEATSSEYALVRLSGAINAVNDHIAKHCGRIGNATRHSRTSHHNRGYEEGQRAGKAAVNRNRVEG